MGVEEQMIKFWKANGTEQIIGGEVYFGNNYDCQDGAVYIDNHNETLDSLTIFLPPQNKIELESFDIIEITGNNINRKTLAIDTFVETQVAFNPDKFKYTIQTMSKSKLLERVLLPNVSWTKRALSIDLKTALINLLDDYSPKIVANFSGLLEEYVNKYNWNFEDYEELLENTKMPEISLKAPTLREAVDTLLSVINCICYLDAENYIKILDLQKRGNAIDTTKLNRIERSQSSQDYASDLEISVSNASHTSLANVDNLTRACEYIGWRNDENILLTTDNVRLETDKPIYDLLSLKICGLVSGRAVPTEGDMVVKNIYAEIDIVNGTYSWTDPVSEITLNQTISHCVEEKAIYDSLDVEEKKHCVYWTRGGKEIEGWGKVYTTSSIWNYDVATNMMKYLSGGSDGNSMLGYKYGLTAFDASGGIRIGGLLPATWATYVEKPFDLVNWFFKVEYLTESDVKLKAGKNLPTTHQDLSLVDNQQFPFVDANQLGKLEYSKISRLGNLMMTIHGDFESEDDIPKLGDTINDYVLIRREMQIFDNHIVFKGTMTLNNVNINYFTGLSARKRSWQLATAKESFTKELLKKYYCEFSFNAKTHDTPDNDLVDWATCETNGFARSLLFRVLKTWATPPFVLPVKSVIVGTWTVSGYYQLALSKYVLGNSISFVFGYDDNISVGRYVSNTADFGGGHLQSFYKYTTDEGTQSGYYLHLMRNIDPSDGDFTWLSENTVIDSGSSEFATYESMRAKQRIKPKVNSIDTNQRLFYTQIANNKDNREIVRFNLQFEFCADNKDIVFGEKFIQEQHLIATTRAFYNDVKIYGSTTHKYKEGDKYGIGTEISGITVSIANGNQSSSFTSSGWDTNTYRSLSSYAICDSNRNILVAVNKTVGNSSHRKQVFLNILKSRDRKIYTDTGLRTWEMMD